MAIIFASCNSQTAAPGQASPTATVSQEESLTGSIADLMSGGKNLKCVWQTEATENAGKSSGTIMISGKKFRQDIKIEAKDTKTSGTEMNAISDGESMFVWGAADPKNGFKLSLAGTTEAKTTAKVGQTEAVDVNKKVDFRCSPWSVDESSFVLPEGVKFVDLSQMTKQIPANLGY